MNEGKVVTVVLLVGTVVFLSSCAAPQTIPLLDAAPDQNVKLDYSGRMLMVTHPLLGDKPLRIDCMEAYCKKGSTHRRWENTIIPQQNEVVSKSPHEIKVKTSLAMGVEVMHRFAVVADEILFEATFTNLNDKAVDVEWMQPCIRIADFAGLGQDEYISRCFIFTKKGLTRLNETNRTEEAIYRGGQVYVPAGINRDDVNPRPLSPDVPANNLIGCFSADEKALLATAWTDVQELFQGVIVCIHADPRIGGLAPHQTKKIWGKLYIIPNDINELLRRYHRDLETKPGD
ncbi:MAG: hypothetical protein WAV28_12370 [Sedimentisphaerales bacterium]|jgi:hypothetical protein